MEQLQASQLAKMAKGTIVAGDGRVEISSVSINSKEITAGALFVPIVGERVDAHKFIDMALEQGAVATFTSKPVANYIPGKVYIQVDDTVAALQRVAEQYRHQFSLQLIGITGSVGKTTTKEMIAAGLEDSYKVLKTKGNMNSQIGLPLMMFEIDSTMDIAVIEMGMSEPGEMARLAKIADPDLVVMTNIGVSHIGQLGSQENIRKEKMHILDYAKENTTLYINGDDPLLRQIEAFVEAAKQGEAVDEKLVDSATYQALQHVQVVTFGLGEDCQIRASQIEGTAEGQKFVYSGNTVETVLSLNVLGEHNVKNATVAVAIAQKMQVPIASATAGLLAYKPIAMRGQKYQCAGRTIIDDTYNASPDSMKSAISVLLQLEGINKRIVVFADVLELGAVSYDCHYQVGQYLANACTKDRKIDLVVTVGTEAKAILKGVTDTTDAIVVQAFDTNADALDYLYTHSEAGDGMIVKGSRGMHMEEIVEGCKKWS